MMVEGYSVYSEQVRSRLRAATLAGVALLILGELLRIIRRYLNQ